MNRFTAQVALFVPVVTLRRAVDRCGRAEQLSTAEWTVRSTERVPGELCTKELTLPFAPASRRRFDRTVEGSAVFTLLDSAPLLEEEK
jgi:hypothetical protein